MKNDWVISVLLDLKEFVRHNGLPRLADELDAARLVGLMEMEQVYDAGCIALNESLENQ
jgi:hypothetical protein